MDAKMVGACIGAAAGLLWCNEAHAQAKATQGIVAYQSDEDVNNYDPYWRRFNKSDEPKEPESNPDAIRFEIGMGIMGMSTLSGSGDSRLMSFPVFYLRFRLNKTIALVLEPAYARVDFDVFSHGMAGVRPAAYWTLVQGGRRWPGAAFYGITGLDVWFPTSEATRTPTMFLGGDLGLGAMLASRRFSVGFGAEVRALMRGGIGNQESLPAQDMSSFRFGVEVRPMIVHMCF